MTSIQTDYDSARAALTRLIPIAMSDTGQARRVANFLMAWWNGPDLGHFEIADLFGLDVAIANDITSVIGFLGQNDRGAVYIDSLGFAEEMQDIIAFGVLRSRESPDARSTRPVTRFRRRRSGARRSGAGAPYSAERPRR